MTIAERVKAVRARARVRRWEYRQRNLAHGAWDRFRTALAHAREAYAIDEATAEALLAEGCLADDRGRGLEPPRTLVWIPAERAASLAGARPLALRLNADLLGARCLALVPFPSQ
jgi:hypothetical protein